MEDKLILNLKDEKFIEAVNQLREANINIYEIVREYLINYLINEDVA